MNNLTERELSRKIGKVAGDCRLGDSLNKEVIRSTDYRLTDVVLRNTVDNFNNGFMVINTQLEAAAVDEFSESPRLVREM